MIDKEPSLFSSSIRDNILYGATNPRSVTEQQLIQAATEANAISFIEQCPDVRICFFSDEVVLNHLKLIQNEWI